MIHVTKSLTSMGTNYCIFKRKDVVSYILKDQIIFRKSFSTLSICMRWQNKGNFTLLFPLKPININNKNEKVKKMNFSFDKRSKCLQSQITNHEA